MTLHGDGHEERDQDLHSSGEVGGIFDDLIRSGLRYYDR